MENRTFWIIAAVLVLLVVLVLFQPTVEEQLAPKLGQAWVAIELEGSDVAEVGQVEIESGQKFTLRAVAGAQKRDGTPVYYTEAAQLRIDGQDVPAEQIRRWDRGKPLKIRWYTVEGRWPYLPLEAEAGITSFQYQEFLRSDWPLAWSVPGEIDALNDDHLEAPPEMPVQLFGTQRYQVRVELYRREDELVPEQVIRSWGVDELRQQIASFPTVVMTAPSGAAAASRVFGLTQLDPPESPDTELLAQIRELSENRIAFSRLTLLRDLAKASGTGFGELSWRSVELTGTSPFSDPASDAGDAAADATSETATSEPATSEPATLEPVAPGSASVAPGDLLRVGDRVVVLYADRGQPGRLDYGDLCFDFVQGAEVRALGEVFSGEGLDVETASLAG